MLRFRLPRPSVLLTGAFLAVALGGCNMAPTVDMQVTVLGHEKYEVAFGNRGIVRTEDSHVRIDIAGLVLDPDSKKACAAAEILFKDIKPKTILMEDITDEEPTRLIYDDNPKVWGQTHVWKQTSSYKDLSDDRFAWLKVIDNSVRVYRFTITTEDGQTLEYRQATMYASFVKESIRKGMGSNY